MFICQSGNRIVNRVKMGCFFLLGYIWRGHKKALRISRGTPGCLKATINKTSIKCFHLTDYFYAEL
jgi:hypothetical protein